MDAATLQAVAAISAVMVALAALLAGFIYWLHRDLKQDFISESRRLDAKGDRNREETLAEMRRGNAQLLAALNGHTHDENTGAAVCHEIPTAADDD